MKKIADRTVELDKGHVDIYTENGVTLYAYQTRDLIDNEVFILAKNGRGVVIEAGAVVRGCVILPGVYIGAGVHMENAVVDKKASIIHRKEIKGLPDAPLYIRRRDRI